MPSGAPIEYRVPCCIRRFTIFVEYFSWTLFLKKKIMSEIKADNHQTYMKTFSAAVCSTRLCRQPLRRPFFPIIDFLLQDLVGRLDAPPQSVRVLPHRRLGAQNHRLLGLTWKHKSGLNSRLHHIFYFDRIEYLPRKQGRHSTQPRAYYFAVGIYL